MSLKDIFGGFEAVSKTASARVDEQQSFDGRARNDVILIEKDEVVGAMFKRVSETVYHVTPRNGVKIMEINGTKTFKCISKEEVLRLYKLLIEQNTAGAFAEIYEHQRLSKSQWSVLNGPKG